MFTRGTDATQAAARFERASVFVRASLETASPMRHLVASVRDPIGAIALVVTLAPLPVCEISFSDDACCTGLRQFLTRRTMGVRTQLLGPGVLDLTDGRLMALQGRSRQAVRTGLHHATAHGITVSEAGETERIRAAEDITFALSGQTTLSPDWLEARTSQDCWFVARDRCGAVLALANVQACQHVARLKRLIAVPPGGDGDVSSARYLLHTTAVRWASDQGAPTLVTDSPLGLSPGLKHFQHLLGYQPKMVRLL